MTQSQTTIDLLFSSCLNSSQTQVATAVVAGSDHMLSSFTIYEHVVTTSRSGAS